MARTKGAKNRPGYRRPGPKNLFGRLAGEEQLDVKHKILNLLTDGQAETITQACDILGINPARVYSWGKNDPDFRAAIQAVREVVADKLEKELREHPNFIPKMFALKAYRKEFRDNYRYDGVDSKLGEILEELAQKTRPALPAPDPKLTITVEAVELPAKEITQ